MKHLNWQRVQSIIDQALHEDLGKGDLTTSSVVASDRSMAAEIVSKDTGIIAGTHIAEKIFLTRDPDLKVQALFPDSSRVSPGATVLHITGSGKSILEAERTALNIMGRLSGIATKTCEYVEKIQGTKAQVLDTRKTAPLLRELDKFAVRMGGAQNHRLGLYDMILIKENHIKYAGGIKQALEQVNSYLRSTGRKNIAIEIEVRNITELQEAIGFDVDRVMLDNFSHEALQEAVVLVAGRFDLEASGGVTLETVRAIAETGVDYISVGALTHSVMNFDLSLLFV